MSEPATVVVGQKRDRKAYRRFCVECSETLASYALKGTKVPILCAKHFKAKPDPENYFNCTRRRCVKCNEKTPSFNYPTEKIGRYCSDCRLPAMVNVMKGTCESDGCSTRATFGVVGSPPRFCARHAEKGMVDLYTKRCEQTGCARYAMYARAFGESPRFCLEHGKIYGCELDVKSKRCEFEGCTAHACMGERNKSKKFCSVHSEKGMVNLKAALCEICTKRASFGVEKPTRCRDHFVDGMKRLTDSHRVCIEPGCSRVANYISEDDRTPKYCSIHAKDGMFNKARSSRVCIVCKKVWAAYGTIGSRPSHCFSCKSSDMVDITNLNCETCKTKRALFGFLLHPASRCFEHRESKMYKNRFCIVDGCYARPEWGFGNAPIHCFTHRDEAQDENLVETECKGCKLTFYCNADGLCDYCSTPARREKEIQTVEFLNGFYGAKLFKANQVVDSNCSTARPDMLYDFGDRFVAIEVDEDQHRSYSCEDARMVSIYNSIGGPPVVFIRFNPDRYYNSIGGLCLTSLSVRLKFLREFVETLLRTEPKHLLQVHYLFFDGFDGLVPETRVILSDSSILVAK